MKLAGKKGLTHRYIIPDTLNGPEPDPEYHECKRCGVRLARTSLLEECEDCKGLNARKASNSEQRYISGNFLPIDPAYEVSLHFPNVSVSWDDRTVATLASLRIPYFSYYGTKDPIEFEYARSLHAADIEPRWPIVLITAHGEPIDWWDGFDLSKLNAIPSVRAAATTPSAPSVTDSQEQAA